MKANYKPKVKPGAAKPFQSMSDKELKAWNLIEPYRMKEYDAYANAMEITCLYTYARVTGCDAEELRHFWEEMIRDRVEARTMLRQQDGEYQLVATGKNVEDFYFREELRKMGADVMEWLKGLEINFETGEVSFHAPD